jgi:hypothetical protein
MIRLLIGSIVGGIVQFAIGGIAWMVIGAHFFTSRIGDAQTADLQSAMARTLSATGTGTYMVPSPATPAATALYGRGPVALIFFRTEGLAVINPGALFAGLGLSILMLLLVGLALRPIIGFAARLRVSGLFAVAMAAYFVLAMPLYNLALPWGWWIFLAIEELVAFGGGVFILVRWFMPAEGTPTLH